MSRGVFDGAEHETRRACGVGGDVLPRGDGGWIVGVKWAQDGAFCGVGGFGVVDSVDEEGEAEDIGEEDEFLWAC